MRRPEPAFGFQVLKVQSLSFVWFGLAWFLGKEREQGRRGLGPPGRGRYRTSLPEARPCAAGCPEAWCRDPRRHRPLGVLQIFLEKAASPQLLKRRVSTDVRGGAGELPRLLFLIDWEKKFTLLSK